MADGQRIIRRQLRSSQRLPRTTPFLGDGAVPLYRRRRPSALLWRRGICWTARHSRYAVFVRMPVMDSWTFSRPSGCTRPAATPMPPAAIMPCWHGSRTTPTPCTCSASCTTSAATHARAVELIGRAVALRPDAAAFHANLAEAYRGLGQHEQAVDCCRTALRLQPDYPEAANNLGLALHALGRHDEAAEQFRAALQMRPDFALAQNNLGTVLRELGRTDEALEAFRAAVALDPDLALARANLGQLLVDRGEAEEALAHCQEAVRLQPDLAGRPQQPRQCLSRPGALGRGAGRLRRGPAPGSPTGRGPRPRQPRPRPATARQARRAVACFRRAVELAPDDAEMWQLPGQRPCRRRGLRRRHPLLRARRRPEAELGRGAQRPGLGAAGRGPARRGGRLLIAGPWSCSPIIVDALLNQGGLHEELGEMAEAEACYRRARAVHPQAPGRWPAWRRCCAASCRTRTGRRIRRSARRSPARRRAARDLALRPGPRPATPAATTPRPPPAWSQANALALDQRRQAGPALRPGRAQPVRRSADRGLHAGAVRPPGRRRRRHAAAGVRLRPAALRAPRWSSRCWPAIRGSTAPASCAWPGRRSRPSPAWSARDDGMLPCLDALDARGRARARPASSGRAFRRSSTRDPAGVRPGPDRGQDAGQLPVSRPAGAPVPAGDVHPRPPRPARRGRVVLDDQLPQHPLGQRPRTPGRSHPRVPAADGPLARRCCRCRCTKWSTSGWWTTSRPRPGGWSAACGLDWEPACLEFHQTARPVRTASVTQVRQPLYRKALGALEALRSGPGRPV